MDARRSTAVLLGVSLSLLAPAFAGAAEPVTVGPTTTVAAEPEVPAVGARRGPRVPSSTPLMEDSGPMPVDVTPPISAEPERPAPLPEPPAPAPAPPPPTQVTQVPEQAPAQREPAGEPNLPTRLPTTGDHRGSRYAAAAGAFLALGGLCIALGARRRTMLLRAVRS